MIDLKTTNSFKKHLKAKKRITVSQGGTSSSKTFSILQMLILIANNKPNQLISIVMESRPALKRGVLRDFKNIMKEFFDDRNFNKTDLIYEFGNGSEIEFFSADSPSKLRGARRDYLWIDEVNNVAEESFKQLEIRTKKRIWLSYNPTVEFWVHRNIIPREDCDYVHTTYKDNEFLDSSIINAIENYKYTNPNWYRVYGLGETGSLEGVVYEEGLNWSITNKWPEKYDKRIFGIDFGFTNSYTAIVELRYIGNDLYIKEHLYKLGMVTSDIIKAIKKVVPKDEIIVADIDKRLNEELKRAKIKVVDAQKGPGSINLGIDKLLEYHQYIHEDSTNLIKEYRGYMWLKDKEGNPLNKPMKDPIHLGDGARYGNYFLTYKPTRRKTKIVQIK